MAVSDAGTERPLTDYLDSLDEPARGALRAVVARAAVLAPDAVEGTSYGMPALLVAGKPLLAVRVTRKQFSLYPFSGAIVAAMAEELTGFPTSKGTIGFSADNPLPDAVLDEVVRRRLAEIQGR